MELLGPSLSSMVTVGTFKANRAIYMDSCHDLCSHIWEVHLGCFGRLLPYYYSEGIEGLGELSYGKNVSGVVQYHR
jgi:hypothetical protein